MRFFLKEALNSVRRNKTPSFAAIASVLVTVLVLGVFIPITQATTSTANGIRNQVLVNVYLKTSDTPADIQRVQQRLMNGTKYVGKVDFVSKSKAYAQQKKEYPEYYAQLLGANPLPDTFRVTPDSPDHADKLLNALSPLTASGQRTTIDPAIQSVKNRKDDTNRILFITRVIKWAMALLAVMLVLASILLISNTIRLSVKSREREVEVMKLVGATDWFVRWPFIIEGTVLGFLGGLAAVSVLLGAKLALIDPLISNVSILRAPETMSFGVLVVVLLAASVGVSAAGSGLSLRRALRI